MVRRLTSAALLLALVAVQAAPLAAGGTVCRMEPSAPAELCASCDLAPTPGAAPAIRAGSCCRFEAAPTTSSLPGVVTSAQSASQDTRIEFAAIPGAGLCADASADRPSHARDSARRSTRSPEASSTSLRL